MYNTELTFKQTFRKCFNKWSWRISDLDHFWQSEAKRIASSLYWLCITRLQFFSEVENPRDFSFLFSPTYGGWFWSAPWPKALGVQIIAIAIEYKKIQLRWRVVNQYWKTRDSLLENKKPHNHNYSDRWHKLTHVWFYIRATRICPMRTYFFSCWNVGLHVMIRF